MGRTAEAFAELREAVATNHNYLLNLIDLAWSISRENVATAEQLIGIKENKDRFAFIRFLAKKGKGTEALDQVRLLSTPLSKENRSELVHLLFTAKAFYEAFDLWNTPLYIRIPALFNGGFEESTILNEPGFGGWVRSPEQNKIKLAIDVAEKFGGAQSLQINFDGNWNPGSPLLSQTVLVEPSRTYPLSFAVKTKDLITGAPLMITVNDAATDQLLGKSENLPSGTSPWVT